MINASCPRAKSRFRPTSCWCLGIVLLLAGCTRDEDTDYCRNHYRFHDSHENPPGHLVMELTGQGELLATLTLPAELLDSQSESASGTVASETRGLERPEQVYDLHSAQPCEMRDSSTVRHADSVEFRYESLCGTGNKLGQIDVKLFDVIPELDEIEVNITTPATAKHFAISRQCERAIFRLR